MGSQQTNQNPTQGVNPSKPWLNAEGNPLNDEQLRLISRTWSKKIWNQYLDWYENHKPKDVTPFTMPEGLSPEVTAALMDLTLKQRKVIVEIFWNGRSERDLADAFGVAPNAVHEMKLRALNKLPSLLNRQTGEIGLNTASA